MLIKFIPSDLPPHEAAKRGLVIAPFMIGHITLPAAGEYDLPEVICGELVAGWPKSFVFVGGAKDAAAPEENKAQPKPERNR